jgi:hypothetical protein
MHYISIAVKPHDVSRGQAISPSRPRRPGSARGTASRRTPPHTASPYDDCSPVPAGFAFHANRAPSAVTSRTRRPLFSSPAPADHRSAGNVYPGICGDTVLHGEEVANFHGARQRAGRRDCQHIHVLPHSGGKRMPRARAKSNLRSSNQKVHSLPTPFKRHRADVRSPQRKILSWGQIPREQTHLLTSEHILKIP